MLESATYMMTYLLPARRELLNGFLQHYPASPALVTSDSLTIALVFLR